MDFKKNITSISNLKIGFSLLVIFICFFSHSQIVNIESKRLDVQKPGLHGNVEMNFQYTQAGVTFWQIGDKANLIYRKEKRTFIFILDHALVKSNTTDYINRGMQHVRYNYSLNDSDNVIFEAFEQAQFNKIQKINYRFLLGSGLRFVILRSERIKLNFGSGLMFEHESMVDLGISTDVLFTSYISLDLRLSKNLVFNTISYIQPKIFNRGDYRFSNETFFRFQFNEYLSFKITNSLIFDSREVPDVPKANIVFTNGVVFDF